MLDLQFPYWLDTAC